MSKAPSLISGSVAAAGIAWAIHLGVAPEPLAASAAIAIAAGIVIFTVVSVVGLLLVHAPWARWLAYATVGLGLAVGVVTGIDEITAVIALAFSLVAIGGLSGPWLRFWLRHRPSATAPEPRAAILPLAALALVPLTGIASPNGLTWALVLLAIAAVVFVVGYVRAAILPLAALALVPLTGIASPNGLTWALVLLAIAAVVLVVGYVRAASWGLWGLRSVIPVLTVVASLSLGVAGAVLLLSAATIVTWLAWTPAARRAIAGPGPPLPAPRRRSSKSAPGPG
jgi:hypothetical protein